MTPADHAAEVIADAIDNSSFIRGTNLARIIMRALTAAGLTPLPDGYVRLHGTVWRVEEVKRIRGALVATDMPTLYRLVPVEEET